MANPERVRRLRKWWASAHSTVIAMAWETRFWIALGLLGFVYKPLAASISVVYFISCYANAKASAIRKAEAKREMLEEEAEEADAQSPSSGPGGHSSSASPASSS